MVPGQGQAHDSRLDRRNRKMAFFNSLNTRKIPLGLVVHKGYSYAVSIAGLQMADYRVIHY